MKMPSTAAYIGAVLFAVMIVMFNTITTSIIIGITAVAFHVVLFPVVASLPSASWAKAAGYGWLILDITANVMQINGIDEHITSAIRYGAHIPAVIWIITSSLKGSMPMRIVGILQALIMGSYSFIAPWVPAWVLYPAMILLIIWLVVTGMHLSKQPA